MKNILLNLSGFAAILALSACAPQNVHDDTIPEDGITINKRVNNNKNTGTKTYALSKNRKYTPADLENKNSILAKRIVYFAYDKSEIDSRYVHILEAHASLLTDYPHLNVRLEGHADERASREYNVALSERRSKSVQAFITGKGAKEAQMQVIAYGEEKPAVEGHNFEAWSKNRRVEIKYVGTLGK